MTEIAHEIGAEREAGKLLKTGQTTQYGGYADDGYYEKGLSRQYDLLTTGRYAGTTDITLNAKTDSHSNNCVYDKRTKLMWSRYVAGSVGPGSNGKLPWTTNGNGEGIFAYVDAANAALLAGYSDWRIPNDLELESIRIMGEINAAPNPTAFPDWPLDDYICSSTASSGDPTAAFGVYYTRGSKAGYTKTESHFVALVRGG